VVDSRATDDGTAIRRRRQCQQCNARFTTIETVTVSVTKRNGVSEPFSRDKVLVGVRKACQGRPVSEDDLALLAQQVEEAVRATGLAEVASHEVGLAVLEPLRRLDEVAYLRFASVYRAFEDLADFEAEIALLRAEHDLAADTSQPVERSRDHDRTPVAAELRAAAPAQARAAVRKSSGGEELSAAGRAPDRPPADNSPDPSP
jgi:transcriptional repressor NrdR